MTSTVPTDPHEMRRRYAQNAAALAARLGEEWRYASEGDLKALSDTIYRAFVEEANLELRQLLTGLGGQLELAQGRLARGQPAMSQDRLAQLQDSVQRAAALLDVYLDPASAARLVIRLHIERFDLGEALSEHVRRQALEDAVVLHVEPAPLEGDAEKLLDALGHVLMRFHIAARPHEKVLVTLRANGEGYDGFVGLSPSHLAPEQLVEEMRTPLVIEDVGIEVSYTRAVIERHGGTLFVATAGEGATGFGFNLPRCQDVLP